MPIFDDPTIIQSTAHDPDKSLTDAAQAVAATRERRARDRPETP